jgi:RecA-family ATPase
MNDDLSLEPLGPPPRDESGRKSDRIRQVGESSPRLPIFAASSLAGSPAPPRLFHVEGLIPIRTVTMLGGDGGTVKSLLGFQLAASTVLGTGWLGQPVCRGASFFLTAEDDKDEVHRRLVDIANEARVELEDLADLHLVSLAGEDALLAAKNSKGDLKVPTPLFAALDATIAALSPALVVLDILADLFGGDENNRVHARQFVAMLRGLALKHDTTILLLAHPSLTGMRQNGSGLSGSTAWSNSVRSRLYVERVKNEEGAELDSDVRVLKTTKANYADIGTEIRMRWQRGVFVPMPADTPKGGLAAYAAKQNADEIFAALVTAYEAEKSHVSSTPSANFAPAVFARDPRSQGIGKKALGDAMNRLFAARKIEVIEFGPPSRRLKSIVRARVKTGLDL